MKSVITKGVRRDFISVLDKDLATDFLHVGQTKEALRTRNNPWSILASLMRVLSTFASPFNNRRA